MRFALPVATALLVGACGSGPRAVPVAGFQQVQNTPVEAMIGSSYIIGPADKLNVTTFQVPDLTFKEVSVDAAGSLQMPLIGSVRAAGLTPEELADELERLLGERYLRSPQVTITVAAAASQKITVDGAVTKPGVYEMMGNTTLLQAVAMAEGPVRTADLRQVAVFRNINDQRSVAVFDLAAIRAGVAPDPQVIGNDVIVVDTSQLSVAMRDVITALPGLAVFNVFR